MIKYFDLYLFFNLFNFLLAIVNDLFFYLHNKLLIFLIRCLHMLVTLHSKFFM